jgi:hypothetical protein
MSDGAYHLFLNEVLLLILFGLMAVSSVAMIVSARIRLRRKARGASPDGASGTLFGSGSGSGLLQY